MLWTATPGIGTSRSHTSNIVPAQLAETFGLLPSQWTGDVERNHKMFANPVFTNPGRYWCSYCPIMAQNRPDMWRFTFDFGAPLIYFATEVALPKPFLFVNRRPVIFVSAQKLSSLAWTKPIIQQLVVDRGESGLKTIWHQKDPS